MNAHTPHIQPDTPTREEFIKICNEVYHLSQLLEATLGRVQKLDCELSDTVPTIHTTSVLVSIATDMASKLSERMTAIDLGEVR